MGLEELPLPIKEHILKAINEEDYEPMPNSYSLTELLGCIRQTHLKKIYERTHINEKTGKPMSKPFDLDSSYAFYRGKLFDRAWTNLFKRNQIRCTYRVPKYPITVSGHFDFVYEDAVWDLKTTKNLYFTKEPNKSYCKQVRFYAYCNSLNKGKLLYVDMGGCKVFDIYIGNYEEQMETLYEIEDKAIALYKSLTNIYCQFCNYLLEPSFDIKEGDKCPSCGKHTYGKYKCPPKPHFEKDEAWHCNPKYCSYYNECQNEVYGEQTKLFVEPIQQDDEPPTID